MEWHPEINVTQKGSFLLNSTWDIFNNPILIFKNKFASIYIIFLGMDGV